MRRNLMILFHRTPYAESILARGFEDRGGTFGTLNWYEGVWLSDVPLDFNDGVTGDLLTLEIPDDVIADDEWIEECKPFREWLVPAEMANRYPVHRAVERDDYLW
jgi:hypothetical protein